MALPLGQRTPRQHLCGVSRERPQLEGYPTHQPEPCSSLHHARIVDVAFELRVFSRLLLSSKASRCHTTLSMGNLECKLLRCYYSPKWPFPRSRNPTIMPHTQFVANAKDASLPPIHAGTAQMHRFSVSRRNLVDVKHGSQVHFRRKLRLLDQRHSRWAIAPCLSIPMPLHSPHPSERRGKNNPLSNLSPSRKGL